MKKILFFISIILPALLCAQNSYTVSNIPGVTANYYSLQGALDSVPAGSTIYLFPSQLSYGGGVVNKKVAIYGNGFLLDQNPPPATTVNTYGAHLQYLDIKQGGSNSFVEGIQFNNTVYAVVPGWPTGNPLHIDSAVNVTISRCAFYPLGGGVFVTTNATYNCTIRDCYMDLAESGEGNSSFVLNDNNSGSAALQFSNNIITNRRIGMRFYCANVIANSDISFTNNTIIASINGSNFANLRYTNNIIFDTDPTTPVTLASAVMLGTVHNNITNKMGFLDSTQNNYSGANMDGIFAYSTFGFHGEDQQWQLQPGSFANTYGTNGLACGAYGGENPYTLSGIPNLPNAYAVTITKDSLVRGNVLVRIKAKASN